MLRFHSSSLKQFCNNFFSDNFFPSNPVPTWIIPTSGGAGDIADEQASFWNCNNISDSLDESAVIYQTFYRPLKIEMIKSILNDTINQPIKGNIWFVSDHISKPKCQT